MKTHESSQFYFTYKINRYEKTKFVISFDIKNILFHEKKEKIHSSVRTNDRRKHLRITVNRRDEAIAAPSRIVVAPEILQFFLAESRQIFRSRLVPRSDPFLFRAVKFLIDQQNVWNGTSVRMRPFRTLVRALNLFLGVSLALCIALRYHFRRAVC